MAEPTLPLTGAQYDIAAGDYQATITELGAGLRALSLSDQPLIRTYAPDELPPAGAGQLLAPWPNRVDHGRYSFDGACLSARPLRARARQRHPRPHQVGRAGG